jgi:aspartyl-tRNA(Asn)/glutamyl-tRNA(Gln) amidotransferase subunit A
VLDNQLVLRAGGCDVTDLTMLSAVELAAGFAVGDFSPGEVTDAALDLLDSVDPQVHAMVLVDADGAREQARASTRRWRDGEPLSTYDGVPTTVKDILLARGWPTLRGSLLVDEAGPWDEDGPAVARMRESGAVLLGKTSTPEFGWKGVTDSLRHGATGNPWDAGLTAGGSSGGAAAAVGLGIGPWAVGTDGGGSVRIPASFTGTVALKPTFGRIPLYPASAYGTLGHAGPMTRSVTDAALLLDLVSGFDSRDWNALPPPDRSFADGIDDGVAGLRVAFSPTLGFGRNDTEVESAVRAAAGVLAEAGAHVEEVEQVMSDPVEAFHVLWFSGAAKVVGAYGDRSLERVDPMLRETVQRYADTSASHYLDAVAERMALGIAMGAFHETYDLLVCPTTPIAAFPVGQDAPDGWPSRLWTSWQQPALSVPCGFTSDGRPVGLQVVGPRHADALVLRAGRAYEARTPWHRAVPTLRRTVEDA